MWKRKLEAEAVEAVKWLNWKRKRKHFDEKKWKRKRTRKRQAVTGAGSKKFQRWGSGSELESIKRQEDLEAEALKIWLLPHPWLELHYFIKTRIKMCIKILRTAEEFRKLKKKKAICAEIFGEKKLTLIKILSLLTLAGPCDKLQLLSHQRFCRNLIFVILFPEVESSRTSLVTHFEVLGLEAQVLGLGLERWVLDSTSGYFLIAILRCCQCYVSLHVCTQNKTKKSRFF